MKDIRQSPQFASFMRDLNWQAEKIGRNYAYLKKFPLIGYFAKMPRPNLLGSFSQIRDLKKRHRIFQFKIAPFIASNSLNYNRCREKLIKAGFKIEKSPFNPTVTIRIDLTRSKEVIFNNFKQAKRRGVRRAIKNNVVVKESSDIDTFINIRRKQYFPLGFLMETEMKKLWKSFYPDNASLLLAYATKSANRNLHRSQTHAIASICDQKNMKPVAGILLLFYDNVAYYWFASSLRFGKKLFAPTLLVWEALKISKKKGCGIFDFEGICDGRFPEASASWRGFTKFKEGFGGKETVYMENFSI